MPLIMSGTKATSLCRMYLNFVVFFARARRMRVNRVARAPRRGEVARASEAIRAELGKLAADITVFPVFS